MAAETLSRAAFPHHAQLWRVWTKEPGASIQILGQTVSGYLLVSVFFAYDVLLYLVMTKVFGWWSPAEALIHPDVLATYVPWLSAIANSSRRASGKNALRAYAAARRDRRKLGQRTYSSQAFVVQRHSRGHSDLSKAAGSAAGQ